MKPIVLTDEMKQRITDLALQALQSYKGDGDFQVKVPLTTVVNGASPIKPIIRMDIGVYTRIQTLVRKGQKELAWHGLVTRTDSLFNITDILVYPQKVSAAYVESDDARYGQWLNTLTDEELAHMRFQGHSHVDMATNPSGTDLQNWRKFSEMLGPDDFYIFCIANKSNSFTWELYDRKTNCIYETKDLDIQLVDFDGTDIEAWATDEIKEMVVERTPAVITTTTAYNNDLQYNWFTHPSKREEPMMDLLKEPTKYKAIFWSKRAQLYVTSVFKTGFYYSTLYNTYVCAPLNFNKLAAEGAYPLKKDTNKKKGVKVR